MNAVIPSQLVSSLFAGSFRAFFLRRACSQATDYRLFDIVMQIKNR